LSDFRRCSKISSKPLALLFEEAEKFSRMELGGKGFGLVEMTKLGLPVPPGLIIPTYVCKSYHTEGKLPENLMETVIKKLERVGEKLGRRFGSSKHPLLVSVRSGAPVSMPGMMDTVLNLGINDDLVEALARESGNPRFAYETYLRFVKNFSEIVLKVPGEALKEIQGQLIKSLGSSEFSSLSTEDLKKVVKGLLEEIRNRFGKEVPMKPEKQLELAIEAVFKSWNNPRAKTYRKIYKIPEDLCTAVVIQAMVFGNLGLSSGTGVCFTRDPSTGEKKLYGEYLMNAQGEDIVAGERTPKPIDELEKELPEVYSQLVEVASKLEKHFKDMQDVEFTIQEGKLFILQTRSGKRSLKAAIKIAVDMVKEGLITEREAVERVDVKELGQLLKPRVDPKANIKPIARGLNASPGAAIGKVVFTIKDAVIYSAKGESVILVRPETKPEDMRGIAAAAGVLTSRGGMTSHAAVVARGLGKPAVVGAEGIEIDLENEVFKAGSITVKKLDVITIDGTTGSIYLGAAPLVKPEITPELKEFLSWARKYGKEVPSFST